MRRSLLSLGSLGFIAGVAWWARRFERFEVTGESMVPALIPGDFVLVDRHAYHGRVPRRGDVVVSRDPRMEGRLLVKRVARVDLHDMVWLEGDNGEASTDSRAFGPVPLDHIEGRVVFRYWPLLRRRSSASIASTSPSVGNASVGGLAGSK